MVRDATMKDHGHEHGPEQHAYRLPYHWCMSPFLQYVVEQGIARVGEVIRGRSVLEIGCGDGFATAQLARYAASVHGVDINERAIAFARMIVEEPNVTFASGAAGDVAAIAARLDQPVDVVASFEVVEHLAVPEFEAFLSGSMEVLPAAGALVLTTPNGSRPFARVNPHHTHEYAPGELAGVLRSAGFGRVRVQGLYLQPPWRRSEHFAGTVPFRPLFRALARAGARRPEWCRTLVCVAEKS